MNNRMFVMAIASCSVMGLGCGKYNAAKACKALWGCMEALSSETLLAEEEKSFLSDCEETLVKEEPNKECEKAKAKYAKCLAKIEPSSTCNLDIGKCALEATSDLGVCGPSVDDSFDPNSLKTPMGDLNSLRPPIDDANSLDPQIDDADDMFP